MTKHIFFILFTALLFGLGVGHAPSASAQSLDALLDTLDATLANRGRYVKQKEARIITLRRQLAQKQLPADRYAVQTLLYDEYYVFDADSALAICNRQLAIADDLDNDNWRAEWHIKRSFVLAATGLLDEAEEELRPVEGRSHLLPPEVRTEYFRQRIYIYSHTQQYVGSVATNPLAKAKNETADIKQQLYTDSILLTVPKTDPLYLWQIAWGPKGEKVKAQLKRALDEGNLNSRYDAMNAYSLAHIYDMEGNQEERLKALAKSAIADVRYCNHDIASLEELARLLYEQGDLEHSYDYITFCLSSDIAFHNRVRMVSTGETFGQIHEASMEHQRAQSRLITITIGLLVLLSVLLAAVIVQLFYRVRRSRKDALALEEANHRHKVANDGLQKANEQMKEMISRVDAANDELSKVNNRISEVNDELRESNYVKEETVGMAFTLCSGYIAQMEEQRKTLARLLKLGQDDLLRKQLATSQSSAQLKEFFQHFDQLFLNIYPDFVEDFNSLLRPEERIVPKEHDLLNTELRIYALVRLGINDSVKIADFLHCSPQTVYNYRLRVRNKSDIPNAEFAATVQRLGKAIR